MKGWKDNSLDFKLIQFYGIKKKLSVALSSFLNKKKIPNPPLYSLLLLCGEQRVGEFCGILWENIASVISERSARQKMEISGEFVLGCAG